MVEDESRTEPVAAVVGSAIPQIRERRDVR